MSQGNRPELQRQLAQMESDLQALDLNLSQEEQDIFDQIFNEDLPTFPEATLDMEAANDLLELTASEAQTASAVKVGEENPISSVIFEEYVPAPGSLCDRIMEAQSKSLKKPLTPSSAPQPDLRDKINKAKQKRLSEPQSNSNLEVDSKKPKASPRTPLKESNQKRELMDSLTLAPKKSRGQKSKTVHDNQSVRTLSPKRAAVELTKHQNGDKTLTIRMTGEDQLHPIANLLAKEFRLGKQHSSAQKKLFTAKKATGKKLKSKNSKATSKSQSKHRRNRANLRN